MHLALDGPLATGHGLLPALAGASVRASSLPAHRQAAAVPQAPISADLYQALDVVLYFSPPIALNGIIAFDYLGSIPVFSNISLAEVRPMP